MFQHGKFKLHSGKKSTFKVNCDSLTKKDYNALAYEIAQQLNFSSVEGVPTGGIKFAKALEKYISPESNWTLIVDDVLTTGGSMIEQLGDRRPFNASDYSGDDAVIGVVIFSRAELHTVPEWIYPIFTMAPWFTRYAG